MFYAREKELAVLRRQFASTGRTAVLVYGKRRVGKSTLIAQAARDFQGVVVNHLCVQSTFEGNLQLVCRSVAAALGLPQFSVPTLYDLFDFLKAQAQTKPILLILDEYQYFKASLRQGELDSMMQVIIDSLSANVKLVLCGSYVTVMRELLEEDNPLFGRMSSIVFLEDMDYYDAQLFYPSLTAREKAAFYAVFGGSPYVLSCLDAAASLEQNIEHLLVAPNSQLRTHVENVMLAEIRKSFDVRILEALGNGRLRYSDIASKIGGDGAGLLDKQLKALLDMETISKESPINRRNDRRKTFYSIKDNLMRFYFTFLFANEGRITRIGEDAFYANAIGPKLLTFISLRYEGIALQYLQRLARAGALPGVEDIGTYWYDNKENKSNGQFDCVVKAEDGYTFYEVKYYQDPMTLAECRQEEEQVQRLTELGDIKLSFICSAGFVFKSNKYQLIPGEDMYRMHPE